MPAGLAIFWSRLSDSDRGHHPYRGDETAKYGKTKWLKRGQTCTIDIMPNSGNAFADNRSPQ